jgi:molybdopterin converting factor small subunit
MVQDALETVLQREPYLRETWASPEEMDRDSLILVNDIDIGLTGGLKTSLSDGDSVSILPLVHGG